MATKKAPPKYRNFCATLHNPTDDELRELQEWIKLYCTYGVYGYENPNGNPHLQIYVELASRWTMRTIRRYGLPQRVANIYSRFAPLPKQASGYCKKGEFMKKEDEPPCCAIFHDNPHEEWRGFEHGTITDPRARTDLQTAAQRIDNGEDIEVLFNEHPYLEAQYGRSLKERYNRVHRIDRREFKPRVVLIIGRKKATWRKWKEFKVPEEKVYYWRHNDNGYQDDYRQEKWVVIEAFAHSHDIEDICSEEPYNVKTRYHAGRAFTSPHVVVRREFFGSANQKELEERDFIETIEPDEIIRI